MTATSSAAANPPVSHREHRQRLRFSLATVGVIAAALLIYAAGAFMATAILGFKREVQVLLLIPIGVAAAYYVVFRPGRLVDPLIIFAAIKLITEIAIRGQWIFALDSVAAVAALIVVASAPVRSIETGVKMVVVLAGVFALMGLIQWTIILLDPHLFSYVLKLADEVGGTEVPAQHPIAMLGLMSEQQYSFLGMGLRRMQSFAKEPSLNVLYFVFPAALAFLLGSRAAIVWGGVILLFCVLSLSGSVFLTLAFAAVWWLLVRMVSIRRAVPYGMLALMGVFLFAVGRFGSGPMLNAIAYMAQYAGFLSKSVSLTTRSSSALANAQAALSSPFGSATLADLPGPMLVNAGLAAGWAGVAALLWYFVRLGRQLEIFNGRCSAWSVQRLGVLLLLGVVATILVFNDYQMNNYAGLVLLAFTYRTILVVNRRIQLGQPGGNNL